MLGKIYRLSKNCICQVGQRIIKPGRNSLRLHSLVGGGLVTGGAGAGQSPLNFGLSENCLKIFLLSENLRLKMQNLGQKSEKTRFSANVGAKLKF